MYFVSSSDLHDSDSNAKHSTIFCSDLLRSLQDLAICFNNLVLFVIALLFGRICPAEKIILNYLTRAQQQCDVTVNYWELAERKMMKLPKVSGRS